MKLISSLSGLAVAALLAGSPAHAQAPAAPTWMIPELLAAAKAEGQLTVYSSTNEQEGFPLWKLFEEATGVKVNYVRAADAALMGKIALEARSSLTCGERGKPPRVTSWGRGKHEYDRQDPGHPEFPVRPRGGGVRRHQLLHDHELEEANRRVP